MTASITHVWDINVWHQQIWVNVNIYPSHQLREKINREDNIIPSSSPFVVTFGGRKYVFYTWLQHLLTSSDQSQVMWSFTVRRWWWLSSVVDERAEPSSRRETTVPCRRRLESSGRWQVLVFIGRRVTGSWRVTRHACDVCTVMFGFSMSIRD